MKLISHLKVLSTSTTVQALIISVLLTVWWLLCLIAIKCCQALLQSAGTERVFISVYCRNVLCFNWKRMYTTRAAVSMCILIIYAMENWQKFCFTDDNFIYVIQSNGIHPCACSLVFVCLFAFIFCFLIDVDGAIFKSSIHCFCFCFYTYGALSAGVQSQIDIF